MDRKEKAAVICILVGIVCLMIPFYYHFKSTRDTEKLIEDFTKQVEEQLDEETTGEEKEQTAISEEDAALFAEGDVIAILEIETLGIRYPVMEGATAENHAIRFELSRYSIAGADHHGVSKRYFCNN